MENMTSYLLNSAIKNEAVTIQQNYRPIWEIYWQVILIKLYSLFNLIEAAKLFNSELDPV